MAVACNRCKARKRRCDGDFGSKTGCSNCKSAGVECAFRTPVKPGYVKSLEDKIKVLESKIWDMEQKGTPGDCRVSVSSESSTRSSGSGIKNLIECAASIPLQNDLKTSVYVGSSGLSIAHMIGSYVLEDVNDKPDHFDSDPEVFEEINYEMVKNILQDDPLVSFYIDTYCSTIHVRYPFLQKSYILSLHNNRHSLLSSSSKTLSMDRFILLMVYAIGAYLKHEGKANTNPVPNHWYLYKYAIGDGFETVFHTETVANIHAILLLVIYKLRKPNGSTIWYLIGSALRLCVDFGLHRRNLEGFVGDPHGYLIKCNTFWSVYALERIISQTFGRPFSISDKDIDIDLPIDLDESVVDIGAMKTKFFQTYPQHNVFNYPISTGETDREEGRTSNSMAILFLKLRKIDSLIQSKLYRVDKQFDEIPREIIGFLQQKMKRWINTLPTFLTTFEYYYCLFLFNKQIRSLLIPYINKLDANDPLFIECMNSSLNVCKLNRKIFDNDNFRNRLSIVSLQTIFLSGITIIYGLFSNKLKWNFEVGEGLRSCSSTLLLLAGRAPTCIRYSETFESLLDQVSQRRVAELDPSRFEAPSVDLFDQGEILKKVNHRHYMENMNMFNNLTEYPSIDTFDSMFNFTDVDSIFNSLGSLNGNEFGIDFEV